MVDLSRSLVALERIELSRLSTHDFESCAAALRHRALVLRVRIELTGDGVFKTPAFAVLLPERKLVGFLGFEPRLPLRVTGFTDQRSEPYLT